MSPLSDHAIELIAISQEVEKHADMVVHFLPKFHPEINPKEYYWGHSKRYFRERSTGNFKFGKILLVQSLEQVPLITIRRFFRRCNRYMSVYRLGATGLAAEYAVKKYRSHRGVSQKDLDAARKAGTAPAALDEEGKAINPHIPRQCSLLFELQTVLTCIQNTSHRHHGISTKESHR